MNQKDYGYYKLPGWADKLAAFCRRMPDNWFGKRAAFLLRKPVLKSVKNCVDCTIQGVKFRLFPEGNLSDKRLLCTPEMLDGKERRFFAENLSQNGWVVDAGANIGGYSLLLAGARPDLRFVAIEPNPDLVSRLENNVRFNLLESRIAIASCAVTESDSLVGLDRDQVNLGKSKIETPSGEGENSKIEVQGYSLLSLLDRYEIDRPAAVKLDIEGHELAVLRGFLETAEKRRWPEFFQVEQYSYTAYSEAYNLLLEKGYVSCLRGRMNVVLRRLSV